jgi:excisionase family DNA binding protein
MDRDEFYTVPEAAKVLGVTDRHVRKLAADGRIEGERSDTGWILFRRSVHEFRDQRRTHERPPEASVWPVAARDLLEEVRALERELGRLQGQRELEAVAESTLRESLERERQRADAERVAQASALGIEYAIEAGDEHVGRYAIPQRLIDPRKHLPRR